jgi:hypothetical protein
VNPDFFQKPQQNREAIMEFVNATPHTLNIVCADGSIREIAPSGIVPRLGQTREKTHILDGIEVFHVRLGELENLPEEDEDGETVYIVSRMVLDAAPGRGDLLSPGELVRDWSGKVIGCQGLSL